MAKPNKENIITDILIELEAGKFNKDIPKSGYYVYIIFNSTLNKIIYIGKGKDKRVLFHFKDRNAYINNEVKSLSDSGCDIEYSIIKQFDNERDAYLFETLLIKNCLSLDIDIYNIAQTHKDIFVKNEFRECVNLLSQFIKYGLVVNEYKNEKILSIQEATNIVVYILKEQIKSIPKLGMKYKIKGIPVNKIESIILIENNAIINTY